MSYQRCSDSDESKRDIPSFIEPRPPFRDAEKRPGPQKGTNLLEMFEEDSESEDRERVQVYLRLKPCSQQNNLYEVKSDRCLVTSVDTAPAGHGRRTQHHISKMYTFSHIFGPESSQKAIFEHVVKDNLKKLPDGHNFTLLTYGASGSGKTYTLMGTVAAPGLLPRSLEYVFKVVDAAQQPLYKPSDGSADKLSTAEQENELRWVRQLRAACAPAPARQKYRRMSTCLRGDLAASAPDLAGTAAHYIWVSFVEIYNEGVYDLLSSGDRNKAAAALRVREDALGNVYVKGAAQAFVRSGEEAYAVLVAGKHNLQVAATGVHARSSRSHCIFTITMLTETACGGVRAASVRLCDLAGSERARHTRNAGARMQESRAINSSLHVLERCLRMLRRNQRRPLDATILPYRESKLTRLLGAGLCGGRAGARGGEAVAMVVTLNPEARFAPEARHVLHLAAVASDILTEVDSTMPESTLESTASAGAADESAEWELMRLRADNERLHFELAQALARESAAAVATEAKRVQTAATMHELVAQAQDMTRRYYEAQLHALRRDMEEMREEYEAQLSAARRSSPAPAPDHHTVAQLRTQVALLEENVAAACVSRELAEGELRHLRACLDDTREKSQGYTSANDEDMDASGSGSEEDDAASDSLEPTFTKEDINRSRLLRRSQIDETAGTLRTETTDADNHQSSETIVLDSDTDDSILETTRHTLKDDDSINDTKGSTDTTEESGMSDKLGETFDSAGNGTHSNEISTMDSKDRNNSLRGTYCIQNVETSNISDEDAKTKPLLRGTYFVADANPKTKENTFHEPINDCDEEPHKINISVSKVVVNKDLINKMSNISAKSNPESDISLAQFEQYEKDANNIKASVNTTVGFTHIQNLKEKRIFFEDNLKTDPNIETKQINNDKKTYFDNIDVGSGESLTEVTRKLNSITDRSPSIVKDDVTNDFEPNHIKKLLGQSFTTQSDIIPSSKKIAILPKKHVSVDIFDGFDLPNFILNSDNKRDMTESACSLTERPDPCKNISRDVKPITTVPTDEVLKKVINIEVGFEKLCKDIVLMEHNMETTEPVKSALEKSVLSKETTDSVIIEKSQMANYLVNTCEEPVVENNNSEGKSDGEKQADTIQETLEEPLKENQFANSDETQSAHFNKENNTIDEFDNIYKDISAPRATEFELLVSREVSSNNINVSNTEPGASDTGKTKYNLRHNNTCVDTNDMDKNMSTAVESRGKVKDNPPIKRNLRLRRRKNQEEDETSERDKESAKLKDIVNLQKEFSDVTLDAPAASKHVEDIASPEKLAGAENRPPPQGFLSCPSKSVTRSRRKLFTPRAEPLDEPAGELAAGGDSLERVLVPRPSYHRGRARRKL